MIQNVNNVNTKKKRRTRKPLPTRKEVTCHAQLWEQALDGNESISSLLPSIFLSLSLCHASSSSSSSPYSFFLSSLLSLSIAMISSSSSTIPSSFLSIIPHVGVLLPRLSRGRCHRHTHSCFPSAVKRKGHYSRFCASYVKEERQMW